MKWCTLFLALALFATGAAAETVFLVGDSTVADYKLPDPRNGWGQAIGSHFSPDVELRNFAIPGRSSRSFIEEGAWEPVRAAIRPGDYVFIQFGHNDEKSDDRHTDPFTSYREYLSRYIDDTRKAGGTPVLVTPVGRGGLRKSSGPGSHGRYPDAMLALAKERGVQAIDLTSLSERQFGRMPGRELLPLFIASIDGKDDTHFTPAGARLVAGIVARAILDLDLPLARKIVLEQTPAAQP